MWQFNRNELCRQRVTETVGWLLREMKLGGAFAAGLDPDTDGEDGKYYIWSEAEIDAALAGTFSARFKQVYGVTPRRRFPAARTSCAASAQRRRPPRPMKPCWPSSATCCWRCATSRTRPQRDDKLLADWNGLTIRGTGLCRRGV